MFEENPELYAEMSKPFENEEQAKKALNKFTSEVSKLRKKHRIAEVVLLVQVYATDGEAINRIGGTTTIGNYLEAMRLTHEASATLPLSLINDLSQKLKGKG